MSSMTFNQRTFKPRAPEKGSFPLDHDGDCKTFMIDYMRCLRLNDMKNTECREASKEYLQCRMDHNLMAKEEWKTLGYEDLEQKEKLKDKS